MSPAVSALAAFLRARLWYPPPPTPAGRLDFSDPENAILFLICGVL